MRPVRPFLVGALLAGCLLRPAVDASGADPPPAADPSSVVPEQAEPAGETEDQTVRPKQPIKLLWNEVCQLEAEEGRLLLSTGLSMQTLRVIDAEMPVEGLPGESYLTITSRHFDLQNFRTEGEDEISILISGTRGGLTIEMERENAKKSYSVSFTQGNPEYRRGGQGFDVRLTCYNIGPENATISVFAEDFATLHRDAPHAVNRYLRPLLRMLGNDLLAVDVRQARQVLYSSEDDLRLLAERTPRDEEAAGRADASAAADAALVVAASQPAAHRPVADVFVPPDLLETVRRLLPGLDDPLPARRALAERALTDLGPPAVRALTAVDRDALSPQQNLVLDRLESESLPLALDQVAALRRDVHFLLDCLYSDDAPVRQTAVDRLIEVTGQPADTFAAVTQKAPHPEAIEALRDLLGPKKD